MNARIKLDMYVPDLAKEPRIWHVTEFIEAGLERDLTPFGGFAALDTASAPLNRRP